MSENYKKPNTPKNGAVNNIPIEELYPELNREQQAEAEYFLNRFLEIMHSIFEENQGKTGD